MPPGIRLENGVGANPRFGKRLNRDAQLRAGRQHGRAAAAGLRGRDGRNRNAENVGFQLIPRGAGIRSREIQAQSAEKLGH